MSKLSWIVVLAGALLPIAPAIAGEPARSSTRILDPDQHRRKPPQNYPYRAEPHLGFILRQLDVRPGDVVIDVGAGDGFWTEKLAKAVGPDGTVWCTEVSKKMVDRLKARFARTPQVKAHLIPTDKLGLPDVRADLVFFSMVYHHLPSDKRIAYLNGLRESVKPTGRMAVIERYAGLLADPKVHGMPLSALIGVAEKSGWVPLRSELMPRSNHHLTLFARHELFDVDKPRSKKGAPPRKPAAPAPADPAKEKTP